MSIPTVTGQLPRHQYVWIDTTFTHKESIGFIPAVWFGLVSIPGRTWGCTVLLESGAIYRNLPPHALAFSKHPEPTWKEQDAQRWDCYGNQFHAHIYDYLDGLECKVKTNNKTETKDIENRGLSDKKLRRERKRAKSNRND